MKVFLVNRFAGGRRTPTGRMLGDVAWELSRRGVDVEVLCSSAAYVDDEVSLPASLVTRNLGAAKGPRWWLWATFWLHLAWLLPRLGRGPCLLMTDPPFQPLAALPAWLLGRRGFVLWTMDLYPEALAASGMLESRGWTYRGLWWLNDLGMRSLQGLVVLGACQQRRLQQYPGLAQAWAESRLVSPWDLRPLDSVPRAENPWIKSQGLQGKRLAIYAGNLGQGHEFADWVQAACLMHEQGREDWHWCFVCRGARLPELRSKVADLPNVTCFDYAPSDQESALLWAADVHLISMGEGWQGVIVPSKLQGALKTASPILYLGPRESATAQQILALERGLVLPLGCGGQQLVEALDELGAQGPAAHLVEACDGGPAAVVDLLMRQGAQELWVRQS